MKHIFNSIFLAGVGVMFSACAARDASPSGGGLTKHSSLAQPADASVTATSAVLQGTNIPRTTKMHPVEINAPLDLRPIPGTALDYVANIGTPIIKVNEQARYACESGIWYTASSIKGPWQHSCRRSSMPFRPALRSTM